MEIFAVLAIIFFIGGLLAVACEALKHKPKS